jgi:hypothetical protein
MVFEGMVFEGTVFEGTVFKGTVFKGAVFEGTTYPGLLFYLNFFVLCQAIFKVKVEPAVFCVALLSKKVEISRTNQRNKFFFSFFSLGFFFLKCSNKENV